VVFLFKFDDFKMAYNIFRVILIFLIAVIFDFSIVNGLKCYNSNGFHKIEAKQTKTTCHVGKCFGAWFTGKFNSSLILDKVSPKPFTKLTEKLDIRMNLNVNQIKLQILMIRCIDRSDACL